MLLKEYVEMVELNEGTTIEDTLKELMSDLAGFLKANDEGEVKDTVKAIFRYISKNVLKVGRQESDRLIEKGVAEKVAKVLLVAKKFEVDVPADVEQRIENSVIGKTEEETEETPTKKTKKSDDTFDSDAQIEKERKAKEKEEKEEEEAHKDLSQDDAELETRIKKNQGRSRKKLDDESLDDVDAFIRKVTHKK